MAIIKGNVDIVKLFMINDKTDITIPMILIIWFSIKFKTNN